MAGCFFVGRRRWRSHGEFQDCSQIASSLGHGKGLFLDVGGGANIWRLLISVGGFEMLFYPNGIARSVIEQNTTSEIRSAGLDPSQVPTWAVALYFSPARCLDLNFFLGSPLLIGCERSKVNSSKNAGDPCSNFLVVVSARVSG